MMNLRAVEKIVFGKVIFKGGVKKFFTRKSVFESYAHFLVIVRGSGCDLFV